MKLIKNKRRFVKFAWMFVVVIILCGISQTQTNGCQPGWIKDSQGVCVNPLGDSNNCGGLDIKCDNGQWCSQGRCICIWPGDFGCGLIGPGPIQNMKRKLVNFVLRSHSNDVTIELRKLTGKV